MNGIRRIEARALQGDQAAEAEDDAALVLAQDPHRGGEDDEEDYAEYRDDHQRC